MGFRKNLGKFIFPNPTHSNQDKDDNLFFLPWVTCKEAIGDLDYPSTEDKHKIPGSKDKDLLKLVPPGDNYLFFTKNFAILPYLALVGIFVKLEFISYY